MDFLTSVIKVEMSQITLENDETGDIYVIPREKFPYVEGGIQLGQIFRCNERGENLRYDKVETESRMARVASLLERL